MLADPRTYPKLPLLGVSCAVWNDGRVLIVQRLRPPGKGRWALPGGLVEIGETLIEAVAREVAEETGLTVADPAFVEFKDIIRTDDHGGVVRHFVLAVFAAIADTKDVIAGDDAAAVAWVRRQELAAYDILEGIGESIDKSGDVLKAKV